MINNGRLYPDNKNLYPVPAESGFNEIINAPGNGIRVYTGIFDGIVGNVLKLFNKTMYVKMNEKYYLINKKSLSEFILRRHNISHNVFQDPYIIRNPHTNPLKKQSITPEKMQREYMNKKNDQVQFNTQLQNIQKLFNEKINNENNDLNTIIETSLADLDEKWKRKHYLSG